ncbi:hypothetical protein BFW87_16680 [Pseudomonas fluorescens]|uniref:DUF1120 domain-containing protein n=1 Tax=Pseudomonas fluorescens TaxID=294 RepID=A0A1T2YKI3_PSEFL|nr:DUF1120 domain-containing protein [Pseudomonas fluorescens]OPA92762.1 hypothetical protein BFW87_16680 [Pseudomonas fluorescens]
MSIPRNLSFALLLAGAGNAVAASSIDLAVKGTITPSACTPSLANGGVADYGKVSAKDLKVDSHTRLPSQKLQMTVDCEAATLFALAAKDNREGTESSLDYYNFGLGLINGSEKLGYLEVASMYNQADGVRATTIGSRDGGETWDFELSYMDDGLTAFAGSGNYLPIPIQRLTTELSIQVNIAPSKNLTLIEEQPIDGSVTFTLHYL